MVSIDDLQEVVQGLFKKPIIGPIKSKTAEIRHLENRHDVLFYAESGPIWIKNIADWCRMTCRLRRWSKSKPDVEFECGGRLSKFHGMSSKSHMPHCRV